MAYNVRVATVKEFKESREIWNKLALSMNIPRIFCTWEWVYTWWEHFGERYEPLILFVYNDTDPVGILPLSYYKAGIFNRYLTKRVLTYCGSNETYPDHLDIICAKEDAAQCVKAVFRFLASEYTDWAAINISLLSEENNLRLYADVNPNVTTLIKSNTSAPFIALNGTFEDYTGTFGNKKRYDLRKKQRVLCEGQKVEYISCDPLRITQGIKTLFHLHELRARSKKIETTFKGKTLFDFHNALAERISKNGWLWLRFLRNTHGEIISAFYGFSINGYLLYYQLGIDPEWEPHSPGTVLFYEVIKEAYSRNYKEFDFLRGNEPYKSRWTQDRRALYTATIYNKTVAAHFLMKTSQLKDSIKMHYIHSFLLGGVTEWLERLMQFSRGD